MMEKNEIFLMVGSYAESHEVGICVYRFDQNTGEIERSNEVTAIENPSYLCINDMQASLYAISEFKEGDKGKLTSYRISPQGLAYHSEIWYNGSGSCYVSLGDSQKHLFIANYDAGSLTVLPLARDGFPGHPTQNLIFDGHGPDEERQKQAHIHAALLSSDQTKLFCSDLGTDRLYIFNYDQDSSSPLTPGDPPFLEVPPGSGPRHIAYSKNGHWLYLLCELNGALIVVNQQDLSAARQQLLYLKEDSNDNKIEAADLQVHPNGRYLYASIRGDYNQIFVFLIDEQTGKLTKVQEISSEGEGPRSLVIDPEGRYLLSANEKGNSIPTFSISEKDGRLTFTGRTTKMNKPTCLKFLSFEAK